MHTDISISQVRYNRHMDSDKTSNSEDDNRLLSLPEAAEIYGFNSDYLRNLCQKGRLRARKIGTVWVTTARDMEIYIKSRELKGRYRKDIMVD